MHGIFNMLFDGRLIFPPIARPRRILDCGSGSGSWATEVAETHPECEVRDWIYFPVSPNIFNGVICLRLALFLQFFGQAAPILDPWRAELAGHMCFSWRTVSLGYSTWTIYQQPARCIAKRKEP